MSYSYPANERAMACQRGEFPGLSGVSLIVAALRRVAETGADVALTFRAEERCYGVEQELTDAFGRFACRIGRTGYHGPNGEECEQYWVPGSAGKVWVFSPPTIYPASWTFSREYGWQSPARLKWLKSYHGEAVSNV